MTGLELVAGYAVGYLIRKWRRVANRADAEVDHALDTGMDRVHELISAKLGGDTALAKLEEQAQTEAEKPRTRERVEGAIIDAAEDDPHFAQQLEQLVTQLRESDTGASAGDHGVAAGRDMNINASGGGVAAGVIHGSVTPGNPPQPGRATGLTVPGEPGAVSHIVAGKVMYADRGAITVGELHPSRREEPARPVHLDPRPASLAGREGFLAELSILLFEDGATPRLVVLHGMGGVGKTSVALEYAHRHLDDYGLVWQLSAEDPVTLSANFAELATLLCVRDLLDGADPVQQVHAALAARPGRWLLLLDNVIDPSALRTVMPPAGAGHVLVTSQYPLWPAGQAIEVPVLDHQVAAEFLLTHTNDTDFAAAWQLANELGGLPLALEQAAAYLNSTGESLSGYSELFYTTRASLLTRGRPSGYDKTVATTWALAFAQLHATEPTAITLLRLLACYAPESIPYRLLLTSNTGPQVSLDAEAGARLGPLLGDVLAVGDAVAALRRYSLTSPAVRGTVSVHRLIQVVTAAELGDTEHAVWRRIAAVVLEAALPDTPEQPDTWPTYTVLLPHILAALTTDSASMVRAVRYLGASGDYRTAALLQQNILTNAQDRLGAEHPDALTAWAYLAYYTGEAGDPAAARDTLAALLPIQEKVLGAEHPETLTTRNNLAHWTGDAGDRAAARDQYSALLPVQERVLGAEHPETLTTRHQFARWTGDAGDPVAARDALAALLPIQERVLGAEHPETLTTRANLAWYTGEAGDPAAARDGHTALLPIRERVLGAEHPDTLITWASQADWTGEAGDPVAARDAYAALLPVREKVLGPDHPRTLTTRHELAHWTGEAGDPVAARDALAVLLPLRERIIGPQHPHTLLTLHELARWTGHAGRPAAARDELAALLPIQEMVLGASHPHTVTTRAELAHWREEAQRSAR